MEFVASTATSEPLSLQSILDEISEIMEASSQGLPFDSSRLDFLIHSQERHPEFQAQVAQEYEDWRDSVDPYCMECVDVMRSFVPPDIFSASLEQLLEYHLPEDIAKRVIQKQCLWIVRLSREEISRLHIADMSSRFDCLSQGLDIVELAAIYFCLPETFHNDTAGKKREWREAIERNLKLMLEDKDADCLPKAKLRSSVYSGLKMGPITDLNTVKDFEVVQSDVRRGPRKSFQDVCGAHSILSKMRNKTKAEQLSRSIRDELEAEDS